MSGTDFSLTASKPPINIFHHIALSWKLCFWICYQDGSMQLLVFNDLLKNVLDTEYLGQVATVSNWAESDVVLTVNSTCRPRKLGLPVLGKPECLGAAANSEYVSKDKGCVGVLGSVSPICQVDIDKAIIM